MMGLICPGCGASFRHGFSRCASCELDLVDPSIAEAQQKAKGSPREALSGVPTVPVLHAGLAACREIERALLEQNIPCYVEAVAEDGEALAPGAMKVGVVVAESDLPRIAELLKRRFEDLIAREGVGSFQSEAIDLAAAEVVCPACGHQAALADGACADCGLFLGAPE